MFDRDSTPAFAGTLSGADYGIFAVSFVAILLIAVLASLCFLDWRAWFPGAESHSSLLGGVRSAVYSFMDYLN